MHIEKNLLFIKRAVEPCCSLYFFMKIFKRFSVSVQATSLLKILPMSLSKEKVFYAVGRGRKVGIYNSWKECHIQTEGVSNAKYRKFYSLEEAKEYVNFWKNNSSEVKECNESKDLVSNDSLWKEFAVNGKRNCYNSNKEKPVNSTNNYFSKNKNNYTLGNQNNKQDCRNKSSLHATPYISPLSSMGLNFSSLKTNGNEKNKKLQNSVEIFKPKMPSKSVNKFKQDDKNRLRSSSNVDGINLKIKSVRFNEDFRNFGSNKSSKHSSSNLEHCIPNTASDVFSDSKIFNTPIQNNVLQSDTLNKSIKSNESSLVTPDDSIERIVKKEVVDVDSNDENESSQKKEEIQGISDKSMSSLKMFESALKAVIGQNSDESERLKSSLKTLLERIITNTNVNPQMEPEGNVDKICEEAKNCEVRPVESSSSPQPSSQKSCSSLQNLSFHSTSEAKVDQKNVDILALNLRMDSFEKRFDTFLKEIGAVASEISHLKEQIKELKEYSKSASTSGFLSSPKKSGDGLLQTTLTSASSFVSTSPSQFHSGRKSTADSETDSEKSKKPTLKRKYSSSDSPENFKRFADDGEEVDDFLSKIKTESVDYTSFMVDKDDYVEVYTDGAAQSNGLKYAKAGIGIWFGDNHPMNVAEAVVGRPTNNTAEIQAARVAIQLAIKAGISKLKIFTDSEFLINCATKWIDRWKRNGWILSTGGPVKNRKELEKLDKVASKISVRWEKVMGHAGIKGNETADRLANEGARKYNSEPS